MTPPQQQLVEKMDLALARAGGVVTLGDIVAQALEGRAQLWARDGALVATEINTYPRAKVLNVFAAAGELRAIAALDREVTAFARDEGVSLMFAQGRPAWSRVGRAIGWHPHSLCFLKDLRPNE